MAQDTAAAKYQALQEKLQGMGSVLVAFSGGVDSTFLLKAARDALGDRVLAVTAKSETYAQRELDEAVSLARSLGARHRVLETSELGIPGFTQNPRERCYFCKQELFGKLKALAQQEGLAAVVDGANADDQGDWRPGMRAARELGVVSPLLEVGLTKEEIRRLSREFGLPTWDKPSMACLASRIPYGQEITPAKLNAVFTLEELLRQSGAGQVRVRHHGDTARIEVLPEDFSRVLGLREELLTRAKALGFIYLTLDLAGYRTGSMNETLGGIAAGKGDMARG